MKKLILIISVLLLFGACAPTQKPVDENKKMESEQKDKVDIKEPEESKPEVQKKDEMASKSDDAEKKVEEKQEKEESNPEDKAQSDDKKSEKSESERDLSQLKEGYRKGNLAKDIELELWKDNEVVKLSDYKGSPIVLNFWASWCHYCVAELPELKKAQEEYEAKGVKFITVNITFQDSIEAAKKAMDKIGGDFIVASDNTGNAASAFGVRPIPANIFIDKDGVIYENIAGGLSFEKLKEYIEAIL